MSLQLPTILSPPTPCTPVPTLTSRRRSGRGVTVLPFPGGFRSGLRLYLAGSLMHQAVSSSSFCYLWTGRSLQVAPHPASRRRSFPAKDSQCSVRWGLPPHCWCALSGALSKASRLTPELSKPSCLLPASSQRVSGDRKRGILV